MAPAWISAAREVASTSSTRSIALRSMLTAGRLRRRLHPADHARAAAEGDRRRARLLAPGEHALELGLVARDAPPRRAGCRTARETPSRRRGTTSRTRARRARTDRSGRSPRARRAARAAGPEARCPRAEPAARPRPDRSRGARARPRPRPPPPRAPAAGPRSPNPRTCAAAFMGEEPMAPRAAARRARSRAWASICDQIGRHWLEAALAPVDQHGEAERLVLLQIAGAAAAHGPAVQLDQVGGRAGSSAGGCAP